MWRFIIIETSFQSADSAQVDVSSWQTKTKSFIVFLLQRWKQKMLVLMLYVFLTLWGRQTASDVFVFFRTNCVTPLIISSQHHSIGPVCFIRIWLYLLIKSWVEGMISMIESLSGAYTAMSACHPNTKAPHPASCQSPPLTTPPPPILLPLSW